MAMKTKKHIPLQKTIWCKIRYWQLLHDLTDDELAMYLNCSTRTLQNYDHDAKNLTLKTVDTFRVDTGRIKDLITHNADDTLNARYRLLFF